MAQMVEVLSVKCKISAKLACMRPLKAAVAKHVEQESPGNFSTPGELTRDWLH